MRVLSRLFAVFLLGASQAYAADNAVVLTPGSGVTMRSVDVGSGVQSSVVILGSTAGAAIYGTAGTANANVLSVQGIASGTNLPVSQGTAANLNATVVGTGTFVTQSTLAAETTKVIGTVRNLGNSGATTDFAGQAATAPANAWLVGGTFFTTPTTLTNGQASPIQMDNAGNLLVNVKAGAGGGLSVTDEAAWTAGSSAFIPTGGVFNDSAASLTSGQQGTVRLSATRQMHITGAVGALLDGADVTQGAKADAACANGSSSCSVNARLAHIENVLAGPQSPSSTITGSLTPVVCGSTAQTCVIANSAGHNLYSLYAECAVAATCWLVVANQTTALTTGSTTTGTASGNIRECIAIAAHTSASLPLNQIFPDNYSVGISAALSSTECASITVSASANGFIKAMIQ